MGLEYSLLFSHVLVVWIRGHVWVIAVGIDVFKAVEGMAKAGDLFGLRLDEAREAFVLPMLVEDLEEFDGGASDAFDVSVGRRHHHRFKDVDRGDEGGGYLV